MNDFFNDKFNDFLTEIKKKETAEETGSNYINEKELNEKKEIYNSQKKIYDFTDKLKDKFQNIENKIENTKFKKRFSYYFNEDTEEIVLLIDNKACFQLDYQDFEDQLKEDKENFENNLIKELYNWENAYTLIDFVESCCFVSHKNRLQPRFRINLTDFINEYVKYTENKFGADKLINLKRITTILKEKYNCQKLEYNCKIQLTNITTLDIYNEQINKNSNYNKSSKIILMKFVQEFCEVSDYVMPYQRIKRSDFYKVYKAYLIKNNLTDYKLKHEELKDILLTEYNENFIKSKGNFLMKKIKFKKF